NGLGCQMDRCCECTSGDTTCSGNDLVTCGDDCMLSAPMPCPNGCAGNMCLGCMPNTTSCQGDSLIRCDASGTPTPTTCPLGCAATAAPHCRSMTPLYSVGVPTGVDPFDLNVTADAKLDITSCTAAPNTVTLTIGTAPATTISGTPQIATVAQGANPA